MRRMTNEVTWNINRFDGYGLVLKQKDTKYLVKNGKSNHWIFGSINIK